MKCVGLRKVACLYLDMHISTTSYPDSEGHQEAYNVRLNGGFLVLDVDRIYVDVRRVVHSLQAGAGVWSSRRCYI